MYSIYKRLSFIVLSFVILFSLGFATTANAMTAAEEYQAAIVRATAIIVELQRQILEWIQAHPTQTCESGTVTLSRNLYLNNPQLTGADVRGLQKFLISIGYTIPSSEICNFGIYTRDAVKKYQEDRHISPAEGYVGPITLAALRAEVNGVGVGASATISSPERNDSYTLGEDDLNIRWSSGFPVKKIELVKDSGSKHTLFDESSDDAITNGRFDYTLPDNSSSISEGTYTIKLTFNSGDTLESDEFEISESGSSNHRNVDPYEIDSIDGNDSHYTAGDTILFKVDAIEDNGASASSAKGFNLKARLYDADRGIDHTIQSAYGSYSSSSGLWTVYLKAPSDDSVTYEVDVELYCDDNGSDCDDKYGMNDEVHDSFQFDVEADSSANPSIGIVAPATSAHVVRGTTYNIRWDNNDFGSTNGRVDIELINGTTGEDIGPLVQDLLNTGSYAWVIPATRGLGQFKIRVSAADDDSVTDTSGLFSVVDATTPAITSLSRNSAPVGSDVVINIQGFDSRNYNTVIFNGKTITARSSADGKMLSFVVPQTPPGLVHVSVAYPSLYSALPAVPFTVTSAIVPSINLTAPTSGQFARGSTHNITWTETGISNIDIYLISDGSIVRSYKLNDTPVAASSRTFAWTVSTAYPLATNYKIKLVDTDGSPSDMSTDDQVISIVRPAAVAPESENTLSLASIEEALNRIIEAVRELAK